MKTKVCPECGTTFEAKRTDAICCSNKCRSTFNYKRKERNKQPLQNSTSLDATNIAQNEIEMTGELELKQVVGKIESFEKQILRIHDDIRTTETEGANLSTQMADAKQQMITFEIGAKLLLKQRTEMSDYALYNNFLNVAYQTAKQKGDQFAKTRLVTEADIQSKFNHELKLEILNYRSTLSTKLEKLNGELSILQGQFEALNYKQEHINLKLSELYNQMRFYEARIFKYESLLTV